MTTSQSSATPDTRPVAVVTGGSRGIGAAIARRLAADGFDVVVGYAGNRELAEQVVADVEASGGSGAVAQVEVSEPDSVRALFATAATRGEVRAVVNNAGITGALGPILELDDESLHRLVDVNLFGVLVASREAVRVMGRSQGGDGGVIVNLASVAAHTGGLPGLASYAATKAAVLTFSRGLAVEVGPDGVRVVSVSPGVIATDMATPEIREAGSNSPLGRIGEPEEIAATVSWLVSADAGFVTGTDVRVSGGR